MTNLAPATGFEPANRFRSMVFKTTPSPPGQPAKLENRDIYRELPVFSWFSLLWNSGPCWNRTSLVRLTAASSTDELTGHIQGTLSCFNHLATHQNFWLIRQESNLHIRIILCLLYVPFFILHKYYNKIFYFCPMIVKISVDGTTAKPPHEP